VKQAEPTYLYPEHNEDEIVIPPEEGSIDDGLFNYF